MAEPTLGQANLAARLGDPAGLRINEWLAGGVDSEDFLELYNPDSLPVALGGLFLSDAGDATPRRHPIAPLSYIAGRGFVAFQADGDAAAGPDHLPFRLSLHQETLRLSDAEGVELDTVIYQPQSVGVTQGRAPDGAPLLQYFAIPSPGWINGAGTPGDLNLDGVVDSADVDSLCRAIQLSI